MKIRSLVTEKLLKQNHLCIFIIFKCIFRYYLIIHVFLAHQWCEYKNIYMELVLYFFKCPIARKMLPPFLTNWIFSVPSNKQILFGTDQETPCITNPICVKLSLVCKNMLPHLTLVVRKLFHCFVKLTVLA